MSKGQVKVRVGVRMSESRRESAPRPIRLNYSFMCLFCSVNYSRVGPDYSLGSTRCNEWRRAPGRRLGVAGGVDARRSADRNRRRDAVAATRPTVDDSRRPSRRPEDQGVSHSDVPVGQGGVDDCR